MNRGRFNSLLHRQQMWVYAVGALFVADFVFYGYLPSHRRLQSVEEARIQKERLIQTAESQDRALPALEQSLRATEEAVRHFEDNIPMDRALGTFLGQISEIMTDNTLTGQVIEPKKEIETDDLKCIPVDMKCKGTLDGIFGFCNDLRDLDRLVRIEKLVLKNDADFMGQVTLEAETVIFYRSDTSQGALAGAVSQGGVRNDT